MRVLSVFHSLILQNRLSVARPYKKIGEMALGRTPIQSLRNSQIPNVRRTGPQTTQL